jgi:hypothetical protein
MPQRHKIQNWKEYNRSLKKRGDIFFFIEEKIIDQKRKHNQQYSDSIIMICHYIKYQYKLGYRQVEGFLEGVVKRGYLNLTKVPDYSTMCRRFSGLKLDIKDYRSKGDNGAISVVIDSTGLSIYNMSDWRNESCNRKYKGMRRFKKLHVMMNLETREIVDLELTSAVGNGSGDITVGKLLTKRIDSELKLLVADGAYCGKSLFRIAHNKGVKKVILPPSVSHKSDSSKEEALKSRNEAIEYISSFLDKEEGLKSWKIKTTYHIRSRVEAFMARFKRSFGRSLSAIDDKRRKNEVLIKAILCNEFLKFGLPICKNI